jgi:putative salt-induced outer membrane protein YdiY
VWASTYLHANTQLNEHSDKNSVKGNVMNKQLIAFAILSLCCASPAFAQEKKEAKEFEMDGEFGFIFTTGNTETTSASVGLNARQEFANWGNEYLIRGLYKRDTIEDKMGQNVEQTSAQRFFASAQGNRKLENPSHRLFGFASYEDDRFSNFKYQATLAAGWNQKLWEDEKSNFSYSVGPGYAFAEEQSGESQNGVIVRGALKYGLSLPDTARFTQNLSTEIGSDNTKSRSETAITAQIAGGLSMKLSLKLDHNSDVGENVDKLDTETAVTLVYTFF